MRLRRRFRRFRRWWERFLRLTGLSAGGFLSLTALRAEGCGIALRAMSFIILLCRMENQTTGLRPMEMHPFCLRHLPRRGRFALLSAFVLIRCEQHYGELAAIAATPYPASPDFPLFRGQNKPQISNRFISISRHSAARISPSGGDAAAGGRRGAFPSPAGRLACFPTGEARL